MDCPVGNFPSNQLVNCKWDGKGVVRLHALSVSISRDLYIHPKVNLKYFSKTPLMFQ